LIPTLPKYNRILIAPLHWGLGHATRCIPIIDHFISLGKEIAIGGDSQSFELLKRKYPDLTAFKLPAYNIRYSGNMTVSMFLQGPKLLRTYRKEKEEAKNIVKEWKPDVIISDNRFGVRSNNTHNVYLTHQLNIQHHNKFIAYLANAIHQKYINAYDECWVPDDTQRSLSGRLSDSSKIKIQCSYIGGLTRLQLVLVQSMIDVLVILSGPEPARSNFESSLVNQLQNRKGKVVLVRGTNSQRKIIYPKNISVFDIVDQAQLSNLINTAACIVCRSGYSTIMDLQAYNRKIIYVPTKGQTEQEYLAEHHSKNENIDIATEDGVVQYLD